MKNYLSTIFSDNFFPYFDTEAFSRDFFNVSTLTDFPRTNSKETDKGYEFEIAIPGLNKEHLDIEVKDGVVCVNYKDENKKEKKDDDGKIISKEWSSSEFSRSIEIPENVAEDGINASVKDGVLVITMPKKEEKPLVEDKGRKLLIQ